VTILERNITVDERRHLARPTRALAALVLITPALDSN